MSELVSLYTEAIEICEKMRNKVPIAKATPNEIHLINIFTRAKRELSGHLACIEDAQGTYMKGAKNGKE